MKNKFQKLTVGFLVLVLLGTVAVTTQARDDQGWSSHEWGHFWAGVAEEIIHDLIHADNTSSLHIRLDKFRYVADESADPLTYDETEVHYTFEMGDKKKVLPDEGYYWETDVGKMIKPQDEDDEVIFTVPPSREYYYIRVEVWDDDEWSSDDLLEWYVIRYNQYTGDLITVDSSGHHNTLESYTIYLD